MLLDGNRCSLNADEMAGVVGYKLHGKPDAVLIGRSAQALPQVCMLDMLDSGSMQGQAWSATVV